MSRMQRGSSFVCFHTLTHGQPESLLKPSPDAAAFLGSAPWSFSACGKKTPDPPAAQQPADPKAHSPPLLPCLSRQTHRAPCCLPLTWRQPGSSLPSPEVCLSQAAVFPSRSLPKYHFLGPAPTPSFSAPNSLHTFPQPPLHLFHPAFFIQSAHHLYLKLYYRVILFIKCINQFYNCVSNTQSPGRACMFPEGKGRGRRI